MYDNSDTDDINENDSDSASFSSFSSQCSEYYDLEIELAPEHLRMN